MAKPERVYRIGFLGDTHCLSRYGVTPPQFRPAKSGPAEMFMDYIWAAWCDLVKRCPPLDVLIFMGDAYEGEASGKYDPLDALTDDLNVQADATVAALGMLRPKVKKLWMLRGTQRHEGRHFEILERIALELDAQEWADRRRSGFVLEGTFHGLHINATHHMTTGWLYKGTAADRTALLSAAAEGEGKIHHADVIARAHLHMKFLCRSHGRWVLLCPCMKLTTPWAVKRMSFEKAHLLGDLGMMVLSTTGRNDIAWQDIEYPAFKPTERDLCA